MVNLLYILIYYEINKFKYYKKLRDDAVDALFYKKDNFVF